MLTRDKEQILLNEIHTLCIEAADHYQSAISKECVGDMKAIFLEAAQERQSFAAELATYIRSQDDQPRLPDPDREALALFFTSIKARLANSERQTLIEDLARVEEKLGSAIETSLQSNVPPDLRTILERLLAKTKATQRNLRDLR